MVPWSPAQREEREVLWADDGFLQARNRHASTQTRPSSINQQSDPARRSGATSCQDPASREARVPFPSSQDPARREAHQASKKKAPYAEISELVLSKFER